MRKFVFCFAALVAAGLSASPAKARTWSGDDALYMLSSHPVKQTLYPKGVVVILYCGYFNGIDCSAAVAHDGKVGLYNYSSRTGYMQRAASVSGA
jgi:hypothetical protein